MKPTFGCVLLTMGTRPKELQSAIESLVAQIDVEMDIVIVGNGWDPSAQFPDYKSVFLKENIGTPAGRNAGADVVKGEYLFFLDDDAVLHRSNTLKEFAERFEKYPKTGLIQPRVKGLSNSDQTPKRWVPRLRRGDKKRSGKATSLWEGATTIRRDTFYKCGGWPNEFFWSHEGIELVWQVYNIGQVPWYAADLKVRHPVIHPERHSYYYRFNARNRVWLAKRNLRFPFSFIYPTTWLLITLIRIRSVKNLILWLRGFYEGVTKSAGKKHKLTYKAHWALLKAGRPPII